MRLKSNIYFSLVHSCVLKCINLCNVVVNFKFNLFELLKQQVTATERKAISLQVQSPTCTNIALMQNSHLLCCFSHAQVLAALKAWAPWLGEVPSGQKLALECIRTAVASLSGEPPPLVAHAAAHLLVSLTAAVRSPNVSNLPEMQALMQQAPSFPSLPLEVQTLKYKTWL
jgi:hypothetical protein